MQPCWVDFLPSEPGDVELKLQNVPFGAFIYDGTNPAFLFHFLLFILSNHLTKMYPHIPYGLFISTRAFGPTSYPNSLPSNLLEHSTKVCLNDQHLGPKIIDGVKS